MGLLGTVRSRVRTRGRGRHYSWRRGVVESLLRVAYAGAWPARAWGRAPGATEVRVVRARVVWEGPRVRVGFGSDLHLGPTTPLAVVERAFERLAAARLDVLLLGGDYVFLDATEAHARTLARLVASVPAKTKLAVLGNHDLWTDHARLERALESGGARVLVNEAVRLPAPHGDVAIVGLDEPWTGAPDAARAFAGAAGARTTIVLAHSPEAVPLVRGRGAALLVCGHTHGGHVALPGGRPLVVPGRVGARYPHGQFRLDDGLALVVSRGLGGVEVPVRAFAPPDVVVVDGGRAV